MNPPWLAQAVLAEPRRFPLLRAAEALPAARLAGPRSLALASHEVLAATPDHVQTAVLGLAGPSSPLPASMAQELAGRLPGSPPPSVAQLLALPGVLRTEQDEHDEAAEAAKRAALIEAYGRALAGLGSARAGEGQQLARVLGGLLEEIAGLREAAAAAAADQPEAQRTRLLEQLAGLLG